MIREVLEGTIGQGSDEKISYKITTTNWGGSPTDPSVAVFLEITNPDEVTGTVMPVNEPTVNGDVITLSPLLSLVKNNTYRVEVKFTINSNVLECYFRIHCSL